MNKKNILLDVLLWTWCLPQSVLGFLLYIYFKNNIIDKKEYHGISIYCVNTRICGGISSGKFIFVSKKYFNDKGIMHEYGHTIQNYIFGPLYLIIIMIPSATQFLISKYNKRFNKNYYKRFPENWADKLGEIKRK